MIFLFLGAIVLGYRSYKSQATLTNFYEKKNENISPQNKSFTFVLYAYNQASWVQRALASIFEQDYENFRIILIDDGSKDETYNQALSYILENNQVDKTLIIRNPEKIGYDSCLSQVLKTILDQEIVIPMQAKDFLSSSQVLTTLHNIFQDPEIWMVKAQSLIYPEYKKTEDGLKVFYSGAMHSKRNKLIDSLEELFDENHENLAVIPDVLFLENQAGM